MAREAQGPGRKPRARKGKAPKRRAAKSSGCMLLLLALAVPTAYVLYVAAGGVR